MEVILIKDIENLGYANDIVNVKPGYANNYPRATPSRLPPPPRRSSPRTSSSAPTRTPRSWPTHRLWPRPSPTCRCRCR